MKQLEISFLPTRNGNETIKVNGYLIHSKFDPIKEAERIIEREYKRGFVTIIFGYGKGYLADIFAKKKIDSNDLLFVEPIKQFKGFKQDHYDVIFTDNLDEIEKKVYTKIKFNNTKFNFICLPNYEKLFPLLYKELLIRVKNIQGSNVVNNNTIYKYSDLWQENNIKNLLYASIDEPLTTLEKKYTCPIVIASGGPSLTKQLPLLKEILPNIILIAAGSTVTSLIANDIEPDYIVTLDGSPVNYENHFKGLTIKKSQLLYQLNSHYMIQKTYSNKRYTFLDQSDMDLFKYIKKNFNKMLPRIAGGGSVANYTLTIARYLTNAPIALIGQDLAYTGGQTHAENNMNRKTVDKELLEKKRSFFVEGYYGEQVMTDHEYSSMKLDFEKILEIIELRDSIYNCTEGGVKIKGMNQLPFKEFCQKYIVENKKVELYDSGQEKEIDVKRSITLMRKNIQVYKQLHLELKLALRALESNQSTTEFAPITLKALEKVDRKIERLKENVILEKISEPIKLNVMTLFEAKEKETREETYLRVYNQNKELYSRLMEAIEKTIQFTKEAIIEAELLVGG